MKLPEAPLESDVDLDLLSKQKQILGRIKATKKQEKPTIAKRLIIFLMRSPDHKGNYRRTHFWFYSMADSHQESYHKQPASEKQTDHIERNSEHKIGVEASHCME